MWISLGFEKEDSAVAEVEVDEMFRFCVKTKLAEEFGP
jgi:hypothetical protein